MNRDFPAFYAVRDEHRDIDAALLNWARVVRVNETYQQPTPMFRAYKSSEVWAHDAAIPADLTAGWKMEKAVRNLPEKHRAAIRWAYVFKSRPPQAQARKLAVSVLALADLVHAGRTMLRNRLP